MAEAGAGAGGSRMPKVDLERDRKFLTQAQMDYMRVAQAKNAERVQKMRSVRRTNLITAGILGVSVLSIFGYSMWSVGSEKFLDEVEEKH